MAESKETKVKAHDMVDVFGTGKSKFMEKGVKFNVHKLAAEKLIQTGKAAKTLAEVVTLKSTKPEDGK